MPDKKLTDNEIMRGLAYCKNSELREDCQKCPFDDAVGCLDMLFDCTLDLIFRQKAELERMQKEVGYWEAEAKEARADIDQAVAEAFQKFAELFKEKLRDVARFDGGEHTYYCIGEQFIDNLVEEMEGAGRG